MESPFRRNAASSLRGECCCRLQMLWVWGSASPATVSLLSVAEASWERICVTRKEFVVFSSLREHLYQPGRVISIMWIMYGDIFLTPVSSSNSHLPSSILSRAFTESRPTASLIKTDLSRKCCFCWGGGGQTTFRVGGGGVVGGSAPTLYI